MSRATIFALSSGAPPAGVAVVRISGPDASAALQCIAGTLPAPRRATLASLRHPETRDLLDRALVLWFPGPGTATGDDLAELHLHGGRAVVAAVERVLGGLAGLRPAEAGEFTRRAFDNGRMDLAEAEGLADLLNAETEGQRRNALALVSGALSRRVTGWQERLLSLSARVEAVLDFADEDDVPEASPALLREAEAMAAEIQQELGRPSLERLRDGVRVVLAGPPNSGKSSLFNALIGRDAAITSPQAGTTRDLIEAPVAIGGIPFVFIDTAGLRQSDDAIEEIGVARAQAALAAADIVLWLGAAQDAPPGSIAVRSKADLYDGPGGDDGARAVTVSAVTGAGIGALVALLRARAAAMLPGEGEIVFNARQRKELDAAAQSLQLIDGTHDLLLLAEGLRLARAALDRITGRAGVDDMLEALFGRFCIGK